MLDAQLSELGATVAARRIAEGSITSEQLVEACVVRVAERDENVKAWAWFEPETARAAARAADEYRKTGAPLGPLHGVPVAIKDIVDTAGIPTEYGTPINRGRVPGEDATLITRLREAGAIIFGKAVTTEFAYFHPGKTANPHDPGRTPGGSSSGSAAAVAAMMVPVAVGSQTNGSMIRPASFCGVHGYKPTFGAISRHGVLRTSPTLDTVGVFARSVEDVALAGAVLSGHDAHDAHDAASSPRSRLRLLPVATETPPVTPALAMVRTPKWERAEAATRAGFEELAEALGPACDQVDLPEAFGHGWGWHRTVMAAEMARWLGTHYDTARDQISDMLAALIEEGRAIAATDYLSAHDMREVLNAGLDRVFDRYDAIVTPAATGEAPLGLDATGDPSFCSLWTFCGTPAISLPLMTGPNGLPVGVQLVGRRGDDARLLRTARWLETTLTAAAS